MRATCLDQPPRRHMFKDCAGGRERGGGVLLLVRSSLCLREAPLKLCLSRDLSWFFGEG